jgi:hypothetical protein
MAWEILLKEKLQFMEHNRKVFDAVSSIAAAEVLMKTLDFFTSSGQLFYNKKN